jgi:hypothetical protein
MFKVSPASLQTFIDTPNCVLEDRVQYNTVHTPNVICDGHLQIISLVGIVLLYCNYQVHRDILTTLYVPVGSEAEAGISYSVERLATDWTVWGLESWQGHKFSLFHNLPGHV